MWHLPGPGIEPVSPALAGGFLTTAPPGKSLNLCILIHVPILFTFNIVIDTLGLKSNVLLFAFCLSPLFLIPVFLFLPYCRLLEYFLEFHFDLHCIFL